MRRQYHIWVTGCLAAIAFLAPLKFGTPVVIQSMLVTPASLIEWLFFSWPNQLVVIGVFAGLTWLVLDSERMAARVDALFLLPLVWLVTQAAAVPGSINPQVSLDTLLHFAVCVWLFYAAAWYVRDGAAAAAIFGGLGLATILVCICALQQHLGGLAQTREYAALYLDMAALPQDLRTRLTSDRVFAWFFGYPNALAAYLVVVFGPVLAWLGARARNWDVRMKWPVLVFVAGLMFGCLLLTGSRGGLIAFALAAATGLAWLPVSRMERGMIIGATVVAVLAGVFVAQQQGWLRVGFDSAGARLDYWRGAQSIARDHTWLGTGPGTFGSIYQKYKTATTEEARLAHNDFLQMWSDSGIVAAAVFAALWLTALRDAFRLANQRRGDAAAGAICAALVGWAVHGLVDFNLYVPGVAMPAFLLLGTLQGLKDLPQPDQVHARRRSRLPVWAVCLAATCVVIWHESRAFSAGVAYSEALELQERSPAAALASVATAANLAPRNSFYCEVAGEMALAQGLPQEAVNWLERALQNNPYRAWTHLMLARAKQAGGADQKEVIQHLKQAVELNPTAKRYRDELAAEEKR